MKLQAVTVAYCWPSHLELGQAETAQTVMRLGKGLLDRMFPFTPWTRHGWDWDFMMEAAGGADKLLMQLLQSEVFLLQA